MPAARRVLLIKADQSVLIFSELGSYKPLNWMAAPCTIREIEPRDASAGLGSDEHSPQPSVRRGDSADDGAVPRRVDVASDVASDVSGDASGDVSDSEAGRDDAGSDASAGDGFGRDASDTDASGDEMPTAAVKVFRVCADKSDDVLEITIYRVLSDESFDLGADPGLSKDGVEDHLQHYLAAQIERIGEGARLVRREYPTPIGPVDIMAVDAQGRHVAIEIKRHGGIDGVEQLTRYCRLLSRDPLLSPVRGIFAAQTITPQARTLAQDRGFECLLLDYDDMKGADDGSLRLF